MNTLDIFARQVYPNVKYIDNSIPNSLNFYRYFIGHRLFGWLKRSRVD